MYNPLIVHVCYQCNLHPTGCYRIYSEILKSYVMNVLSQWQLYTVYQTWMVNVCFNKIHAYSLRTYAYMSGNCVNNSKNVQQFNIYYITKSTIWYPPIFLTFGTNKAESSGLSRLISQYGSHFERRHNRKILWTKMHRIPIADLKLNYVIPSYVSSAYCITTALHMISNPLFRMRNSSRTCTSYGWHTSLYPSTMLHVWWST